MYVLFFGRRSVCAFSLWFLCCPFHLALSLSFFCWLFSRFAFFFSFFVFEFWFLFVIFVRHVLCALGYVGLFVSFCFLLASSHCIGIWFLVCLPPPPFLFSSLVDLHGTSSCLLVFGRRPCLRLAASRFFVVSACLAVCLCRGGGVLAGWLCCVRVVHVFSLCCIASSSRGASAHEHHAAVSLPLCPLASCRSVRWFLCTRVPCMSGARRRRGGLHYYGAFSAVWAQALAADLFAGYLSCFPPSPQLQWQNKRPHVAVFEGLPQRRTEQLKNVGSVSAWKILKPGLTGRRWWAAVMSNVLLSKSHRRGLSFAVSPAFRNFSGRGEGILRWLSGPSLGVSFTNSVRNAERR